MKQSKHRKATARDTAGTQHVTDLNGHSIEVSDLEKAIEQADMFSGYEGNEVFRAYWIDLHKKLLLLWDLQNNGQRSITH